jgi:dienelactone hydrolase
VDTLQEIPDLLQDRELVLERQDLGVHVGAAGPVDMVPPAQSIRLAEPLRAVGATVELELVPGATHFWNGASDVSGIVRRSIEFLRARG